MREANGSWSWIEAPVERTTEHLTLLHDDWSAGPVARVGPARDSVFPVEFSTDPIPNDVLKSVRKELDYYLVELGEPDPWVYAHYHVGTMSNVLPPVHWDVGRDSGVVEIKRALAPLVDRAWALHRFTLEAPDSATVRPSVPILFFGDVDAYARSPIRVLTVGLNPSLREFPAEAPWSRFTDAEALADSRELDAEGRSLYLASLSAYFRTEPYRRWFDGSFEPLLRGLEASYYPGARTVALHTDVASVVATDPTWTGLTRAQQAQHADGPALWRDLAAVLRADLVVVSVRASLLGAISDRPLTEWRELTRVEQKRPYLVRETTSALDARNVLVVHGSPRDLPFGGISYAERERIGTLISERLAAGSG